LSKNSHLAAAVSRCMIKFGKQVKFYVALALVQPLQQAKLQLQLQLSLKKLDRFDRLVLDDLGYVNQTV